MTVARRCQYYAQPLSPAVSSGNDSYNTNSPRASVVTHKKIFRTRGHVPRLLAAATIQGRRLFRSRASDCAANIRGRPLFEGGVYSTLGVARYIVLGYTYTHYRASICF